MPSQYEYLLNILAGTFLVLAQSIYIVQVFKKEITPSLFTWLGWSVLVGISLVSQLQEFGWSWVLVGHLFSALGCFGIFLTAFLTQNFQLLKQDYIYLISGLVCVLLYVIFEDPWTTTIFAITADLVLGIPTILKAVKQPKTERTLGWNIALVCWAITLMTGYAENILFLLFPLYCFLFNLTMSALTTKKRILLVNGRFLI